MECLFLWQGQGHGSFLSRSKTALAKLAETTKVSSKANPTRNSRNFVFSTISSPEHEKKMAVQVCTSHSLMSCLTEVTLLKIHNTSNS